MKFNWEEFVDANNEIAVHCKTEKEAVDFCKQMDEHGMKWDSGLSYINNNLWYVEKEETCYSNHGCYAEKEYYKEYHYKILEWSDYMKKYPIDYLKYGYVVEFENGQLGMYMPSQEGDCFDLNDLNSCVYFKYLEDKSNLKHCEDYDVVKIYGYIKYGGNSRKMSIEDRPLIWERQKEVKKMTVSEICKELGYKVEIIAEEE